VQKAAAGAADGVDANTDLHASAAYRRQMAKVYTARALTQALARLLEDQRSYTLPFARERVYQLLQDPRSWPSACRAPIISQNRPRRVRDENENGHLGRPGLFAGKIRVTDQKPPEQFRLLVEGSGKSAS